MCVDAGLDVDFDFGEAGDERIGLAIARIVVACDAHQPEAGQRRARRLRHRVDIARQLVSVELAAAFDRAFGSLRPGQSTARPGDAVAADAIRIRVPTELERGELLELRLRIRARGEVRAGMRMGGLTAGLNGAPRHVVARVAPRHDDVLPGEVEHLGAHTRGVDHREGAEVADALMDVHLAVGLDREQSVDSD